MQSAPRSAEDVSAWMRVVDDVPSVFWTARPDGTIDFLNRYWFVRTGIEPASMLGDAWYPTMHPDDREAYRATWLASVASATPFYERARFRDASGAYRWFETRAEPSRDGDGAVVRWFGTAADIDDLVRVELALHEENLRNEALLARWGRFRESNVIGLGIADLGGDIVEANAAFTSMLGYAPGERISWRDITPPEWVAADDAAVENLTSTGVSPAYEKEFLARDGRRVPVLVGSATLVEEPQRVLFFCLDLSERRRTETIMRVLAEREWMADAPGGPGVLEQFVEFLVESGLADIAAVSLAGDDGALRFEHVAARRAPFLEQLRALRGTHVPPESPIGRAAQTGVSALIAPDDRERFASEQDPRYRELVRALDIGSLLEVPLRGRVDTLGVATLVRHGTSPRFAGYELELAEFVAKRAALALENRRLRERERRSVERWELLAREAEALTGSLELEEIADEVARGLVPRFADAVTINIVTDDDRLMTIATAHRNAEMDARMRSWHGTFLRKEGRAALGAVLETQRSAIASFDEPHVPHARETAEGTLVEYAGVDGGRRCLFLPLVARGRTVGTMTCLRFDERSYDATDLAFADEYARRAALALENALAYRRERRVSESFQRAALPERLPDVPGVHLDAVYVAGGSEATVGGDWYDALQLLDGRLMLSIGDVAGNGLRAAVTMNAVRQVLRGVALIVADPALMLEAADRALRADVDGYASALVALYDPVAQTIACATAGHAPPVVRTASGEVRDVPMVPGTLLGLRQSGTLGRSPETLALAPGDLVVFYTDGLTEAKRDVIEGERRVRETLASAAFAHEPHPAHALLHAILSEPSRDDVAIVALRVTELPPQTAANGARRWVFSTVDEDAVRRVRHELRALLRSLGWSAAALARAELVAGELLANAVRHAPGTIDVRFEPGQYPVLHVIDHGPGLEASRALPSDDLRETGRGLYIVTASTAAFNVTRRPGGGAHARAVLDSGRG